MHNEKELKYVQKISIFCAENYNFIMYENEYIFFIIVYITISLKRQTGGSL